MPSDNKTTYAGYLTVPGSSTDPIKSEGDTTIGGDIVKNFKAIGDILKKQGSSGIILDSASSNSITSGYNGTVVGSDYTTASNNRTVMLGSSNAESIIPYSVNTIDNRQNQLINGITGIKGVSYGDINGIYELDLGIQIDTAEAGIFDIDAVYIDRNNSRSMASYRVSVSSIDSPSTTLIAGTDSGASYRFSVSNTRLCLYSNYTYAGVVLSIRYTILRNENFPISSSSSSNWS